MKNKWLATKDADIIMRMHRATGSATKDFRF